MRSVKDIKVQGKRVLVRIDADVPLSDGRVLPEGEFRLKAVLPTIKHLLEREAKVILMGHLDRPGGEIKEDLRLDPIASWFSSQLQKEVIKINEIVGPLAEEKAASLAKGEIIMLENLRFDPREEENSQEFAEELAKLADVYVNESFATCHRQHASVVSVPQILEKAAGLRLLKEIKVLKLVIERPIAPLTLIIGGAKARTKIGVIKNLMSKADNILIGGAVASHFFKIEGKEVGLSLIEEEALSLARDINLSSEKIKLPVDVVIAPNEKRGEEALVCETDKVPADQMILDIGPETARIYKEIIAGSAQIVWNGPMGFFERGGFKRGTEEIAKAVAESEAKKIVGGGDSLAAVFQLDLQNKFDHISVGGGAMLEFLAGKDLPGVLALK